MGGERPSGGKRRHQAITHGVDGDHDADHRSWE
jgi:hypothetical protein